MDPARRDELILAVPNEMAPGLPSLVDLGYMRRR